MGVKFCTYAKIRNFLKKILFHILFFWGKKSYTHARTHTYISFFIMDGITTWEFINPSIGSRDFNLKLGLKINTKTSKDICKVYLNYVVF